jgi:hypothetical protein
MAVKATTKVVNKINMDLLKENIYAISKKPYVKIGVLEGKAEEPKETSDEKASDLSLVEVATFHEFGTVHTPERSFLRATVDQEKSEMNTATVAIFKKVSAAQMHWKKGLSILGELIQSKVVRRIRAGIGPELDPKTIEAKGSSKPLIDTGQLVQSIRYEVVE